MRGAQAPRRLRVADDKGLILNRSNGRRMIVIGCITREAIFAELEKEIGEDISNVIIESQRDFVKTGDRKSVV